MGDTHDVDEVIISRVVEEFLQRGVQVIIHTGDIEPQHINPDLYGGLPVVCVLTKQQAICKDFSISPQNWRFVQPSFPQSEPSFVGSFDDKLANDHLKAMVSYCRHQKIHCRLVPISVGNETIVAYCGHERSFDIFTNSEKVRAFFTEINQVYDGVRLVATGHMHRQFVWRHGDLLWVNPGSVAQSISRNHQFSIVNTESWEVILGRLCNAEAKVKPVTVGIVSDAGNIDDLDRNFWSKLKAQFDARGVTHVICCGDFRPSDIGRPELSDKQVYYYLLPEFEDYFANGHPNWHRLLYEHPMIEIGGHQFYVQHGIGSEQADFSDIERHTAFSDIRKRYPHLNFIIGGLVPDTIIQETDSYFFVCPGDARNHRNFATICLPRCELTVSTVSD